MSRVDHKRTTLEEEHEAQATDGYFRPTGNPRHVFERRQTQLCFTQPYYNPIVSGPQKVPNEPMRMTPALRAIRGEEVAAHGARRIAEMRRLPDEFKTKIKAAADRDKAAEAEKNKHLPRLRWWHTRQSVESRDLLKTMKFNNYTFEPQQLLNAKDVVILNLTGCCLGDEQMVWVSTFLQQNHTLRRLVLQGNKITVEGVRNLRPGIRSSHSLIDIDISLNPLGDAGLNELVASFSENLRHTKISKINVSTCDLTPSSGYHIARLIRDFKTLDAIYAWRNRIGAMRPTDGDDLAGPALIFEELAATKTLKHIDLTANCISEEVCLKHATQMEQIARQRRLGEIEKTHRAAKIAQMTSQINEMKSQELWEDERVILAGMERELLQEKVRYRQQQEEEIRLKRLKNRDFDWVQRVQTLTGRALCEPKTQVRLVLMGNHSVTPSTVSRLAQFYDLNSKDDTKDWLEMKRKYDNIIVPRRTPGDDHTFMDESASLSTEFNVFSYETEMLQKEAMAKMQRDREMEEIRRRGGANDGKLACEVLEERLRGRSSQRSRTPKSGETKTPFAESGDTPPPDLEATLDVPGRRGRRGSMRREGSPSVRERRRSVSANRTPRDRRRRSVDAAENAFTITVDTHDAAPPSALPASHGGAAAAEDSAASDHAILTEQSDAELFSDASEGIQMRSGGRQRRTARRVAASSSVRVDMGATSMRLAQSGIGMSINAALSPRGASNAAFPGATEDDGVDAFGEDVFGGDESAPSDMQALFARLAPKSDFNTASGMQRKLEVRMEELRERIEQKADTANAGLGGSSHEALKESLHDGTAAAVEVRPHHETGDVTIVIKSDAPTVEDVAATSVQDVPPEVADPTAIGKALLADGLSQIRTFWDNITALSQIGSPTDDDLELLDSEKQKCARFKASLAEQLQGMQMRILINPGQAADLFAAFVDELVKETDRSPGATALLRALIDSVDTDWPNIVESRALAATAACDGSIEFVKLFLTIPDARFDVAELACSCFFNQAVRIPLAHILVAHAAVLHLADVADELQATWQEFFEDVASAKRAIPKEVRDGRLELLQAMLEVTELTIDVEAEGPDAQSCFSRACLEGDLDVLQLLLGRCNISDVNAVRSDGMTALHSAVIGNNADLVNFLLNAPSIGAEVDVSVESPEGNPLDIAILLQRDGRIATMLKERGARQSAKSAGKKAKPKGKAIATVGVAATRLASRARRR